MRFSILAKIALLFTVVLIAAMSSVLWNTNRVFYQDKEAFVIEINSKLSQSISQVMSEKVKAFTSKLAIFASNYESLSAAQKQQSELNSVLFAQYEDFYHIAAISPETKNLKWQISNDLSAANKWPIGYAATLIPNLSLVDTSSDSLYFQRLSSPTGEPVFAMLIRAQIQAAKSEKLEEVVLVGMVKPTIFSDVVSSYKAALNTALLVDNTGFVYAHPTDALLGQSLETNTVIQEIKSKAKPAGAGDSYMDSAGIEIAAGYEKIARTNLYAVIYTPREEAFRAADDLFRTLIVIGLGVILVGIALSFVFAQLITSPLNRLRTVAAEIGSGNFNVYVPVTSKDEVGDLATSISQMATNLVERDEALENSKSALVQSEKMSAFGQLSAGIAHEVKNPLAGILGHAQLAKAKIKNPDIKKHIDVIESETRRTKEIIEGLMRFARSEKLELQASNLWDVAQGAVDLVEHQLSLQDIKISRHIERIPCVLANGTQIQQVMLNLMMNAGHAMEECESKKLNIFLSADEEKQIAQIRIQDTGTGMPKEVADKIFEPFFTTKAAGKGTGLGLSVSVGIVKDHNAEIYVESEVDVGTSFYIDIPLANEESLPESVYVPKFGADSHEARPAEHRDVPSIKETAAVVEGGEKTSLDKENPSVTEDNSSFSGDPMSSEASSANSALDDVSIPVAPSLDSFEFGEGVEDEEDNFTEKVLSEAASDINEEYTAANALAGFDMNDEAEWSDKTVLGNIPEMPGLGDKTSDESLDLEVESKEEVSSETFSVKIRKPKIKR